VNLSRAARIAARESKSVLASPGGALILGTFWLVTARLLVKSLFDYRDGLLALAQSAGVRSGPVGLHVNDVVVRPLLYNVGTILIFFVPLLTMRTFSEERRSGSLELLMSQPIRGGELLLGKFLGALVSLLGCFGIFLVVGVVLGIVSTPDWAAAATGFLGLFLLGLLFTSVALLLSVFSRTPVEAAVLSLGALLLLVIGPATIRGGPGWLRGVADFISVLGRFEDFTRGLLVPSHIAFFLGVSLVMLALALRSLDLVRWQG
jgi:ABC-2 type transport system permease protein